ncbi:MAG: PAS domain S-box protein, partial [Actinobacteria bacterium]|nr:PAS domain S-box protein [Actinomycetota bacterium]
MNNKNKAELVDSVREDIDKDLGLNVQNIIDAFSSNVLIVDEDHRIVAVNKQTTKDLGFSAENIIGKYCPKVIHNSDGPFPGCPLEKAAEKGCRVKREVFDSTHKRWLLSIAYPLNFESKRNNRLFLHIIRDITKEKEARKSSEKSRYEYKRLFSESPDGIIAINRLGVITKCNSSVFNLTGLNKEDLIGKHFSKVSSLPVSDIPKYFKVYYKALKGKKIPPFEVRFIIGDGKYLFTECYIKSLIEKGKVVEFLLVFRDITEKKEARDALRESEQRYKSLFENSRDGIYKTTIGGEYIDVNPALVKMLGYSSRKELILLDVKKQVYADGSLRPTTEQREKTFEAVLKKKDGSNINVEINSIIINENGKPAYYEGIVREITERKEAENKLKDLSFHDYLTGLYNRAFFEEELKRLDTKRQFPLAIVMGDVNGLKIINDAFGHEKGDE